MCIYGHRGHFSQAWPQPTRPLSDNNWRRRSAAGRWGEVGAGGWRHERLRSRSAINRIRIGSLLRRAIAEADEFGRE
jgi:hypothetical protein